MKSCPFSTGYRTGEETVASFNIQAVLIYGAHQSTGLLGKIKEFNASTVSSWDASHILYLTWFKPTRQLNPTQLLAPWWDGNGNQKVEVRKLMHWDEDGLISKAKAMHGSKAKERIHLPLPMGRLVFSYIQETRTSSHITVTWECKNHHSKHPLPASLPSFYCWAKCHLFWEVEIDRYRWYR